MSNFDDHIVVFIDFLGFKDFNKKENIETRKKLIAFLREIKNLDSDAVVQENNNTKYVRLASSFFSDSLVLACPLKHPKLPDHFPKHIISSPILHQIAKIAIRALSFGLLIREAITVGEFYHEDGIFFGEAFNEAYHLESEIAIYPRIIISNKIFEKNLILTPQEQNSPNCHKIWLTDFDHINYLNYFLNTAFRQAFWPSSHPNPKNEKLLDKAVEEWIRDCSILIDKKINFLSSENAMKPLQKWRWFSDYFNHSIISLSEYDNWTGAKSQFLIENQKFRF